MDKIPKEFFVWYFSSHFNYIGKVFEDEELEEWFGTTEELVDEFFRKFTGYYEGIFEETDGVVDDPGVIELKWSNSRIEFHPGDTYLMRGDDFVGNIGPHWWLPELTKREIREIIKNKEILLMLPFISKIGEEEMDEIQREMKRELESVGVEKESAAVFVDRWKTEVIELV